MTILAVDFHAVLPPLSLRSARSEPWGVRLPVTPNM